MHSFNPCPFFGKARFLCTEVKFFIYVYENHLCFIPWKYAYTLSKHKIYPLQQLKSVLRTQSKANGHDSTGLCTAYYEFESVLDF